MVKDSNQVREYLVNCDDRASTLLKYRKSHVTYQLTYLYLTLPYSNVKVKVVQISTENISKMVTDGQMGQTLLLQSNMGSHMGCLI